MVFMKVGSTRPEPGAGQRDPGGLCPSGRGDGPVPAAGREESVRWSSRQGRPSLLLSHRAFLVAPWCAPHLCALPPAQSNHLRRGEGVRDAGRASRADPRVPAAPSRCRSLPFPNAFPSKTGRRRLSSSQLQSSQESFDFSKVLLKKTLQIKKKTSNKAASTPRTQHQSVFPAGSAAWPSGLCHRGRAVVPSAAG